MRRSATPRPRARSSDPLIRGRPTSRITMPTPAKNTLLSTEIAIIETTKLTMR